MDYNFAERVDKLLRKGRHTKKSLYEALSMTSQGFDAMMKNNSFSASRLAEIANFFDVEVAELYGSIPNKVGSDTAESGKYLQDHLVALEQKFNKLLDQLSVKDQQIAGLQRTVDALVGKSEGATNNPLSFDEFKAEIMYHYYTQSVYTNLLAPAIQSQQPSAHN